MTLTENAIEKQVIDFMQSRRWRSTRNQVGRFQRLGGKGIVSIGTEGFPDWTFTRGGNCTITTIDGHTLKLVELIHFEAKRPGEKPSKKQLEIMASLNYLGELAVWADSLESFKIKYSQYFHD